MTEWQGSYISQVAWQVWLSNEPRPRDGDSVFTSRSRDGAALQWAQEQIIRGNGNIIGGADHASEVLVALVEGVSAPAIVRVWISWSLNTSTEILVPR